MILEKFNTDYSDYCSELVYFNSWLPTRKATIDGDENSRSNQLSRLTPKSDVRVTIMDIIGRCYRDGHQFSPLLTIPNQYDDDFFKSQLEGLINRKMVDIVRQ